jgi:hypothetical protein
MCYILYMCVWVGALDTTTASDDPFTYSSVVCTEHFPRGVQRGGGRYAPPGYTQCSAMGSNLGQCPKIIFWAVFVIFSIFVN